LTVQIRITVINTRTQVTAQCIMRTKELIKSLGCKTEKNSNQMTHMTKTSSSRIFSMETTLVRKCKPNHTKKIDLSQHM
jgi:hypothetical protein